MLNRSYRKAGGISRSSSLVQAAHSAMRYTIPTAPATHGPRSIGPGTTISPADIDLLLGDIDLHGRARQPAHGRQQPQGGEEAPVSVIDLLLPVVVVVGRPDGQVVLGGLDLEPADGDAVRQQPLDGGRSRAEQLGLECLHFPHREFPGQPVVAGELADQGVPDTAGQVEEISFLAVGP